MSIINRDNFRFRLGIFRWNWTVLVSTNGFPSTKFQFRPLLVLDWWGVGLHGVGFSLFDGSKSRHDFSGSFNLGHAKSRHSKGRHSNQRHSNVSFGFVGRH